MPFIVEIAAATGSYSVRVRQNAGNRYFFDFGAALAFSASPITVSQALVTTTGAVTGAYEYALAATPVGTWVDGQYSAYVDNGTNTIAVLPFTMVNGDAAPISLSAIAGSVLNAVASSYNTAGSIGQAINGAASAGNPWVTNIATGYTGTQAGAILDAVYNVLNGVAFPTNFNALAINSLGKVTVGTNADKTGYALSAGEHTAIAGDVLNAVATSYNTAGSIGQAINGAASAGNPWVTNISTGYTGGQAGAVLESIFTVLNGVTFPTRFGAMAIDTSGRLLLQPSGLDAVTVEAGLNARQSLSIIASAMAGTGSLGTTVNLAGAGVLATRITGTTDTAGNRLTIALLPPA